MKIAIIGAGLIGRLTALKLINSDHDVTLLEAKSFDSPHNAAAISAGLIAPLSESVHTNRKVVDMGFASIQQWPDHLRQLAELDPEHQQVLFESRGTMALSFVEEQNCLLDFRQQLKQTVPDHAHDITMLYNDEVCEMEPELCRFETALFLKNEGNLCNQQFLQASSRAIRRHASIIDHWPLQGDGRELQPQYDWIIDCRGAGAVAANTFAQGEHRKLTSVRGEIIRVRTKEVALTRPVRVVQQRFNIYVVPKPNNIYVVGATDLDKNGEHAVTVRSSLELLTALYALHPGFANAEIIEAIAGQRAVYEDTLPSVRQHENIICVNGLNRHGWLIAPAMVERILGTIYS